MSLLHIAGYEWLDWSAHLDVVLICLLLEGGYLYAVTQMRSGASDVERVTKRQVVLFTLGVLAIYVAVGSPLHDLSEHYLASAHMIQHVLLTLVAAPLLLAGVPGWIWQALLRIPGVMRVAKPFTQPVVAFSIFNAALLLIHLPQTIDLQLQAHSFHLLMHAVLVATALLMWWPILSPIPELPRLNPPLQMAYLFMQSLLPAIMASFITFSDTVVYSFYEDAPRIWGMTALDDQQVAGGAMKLIGTLILWSYMTVVFFRWYAREMAEERGRRRDVADEELEQLGVQRSS